MRCALYPFDLPISFWRLAHFFLTTGIDFHRSAWGPTPGTVLEVPERDYNCFGMNRSPLSIEAQTDK